MARTFGRRVEMGSPGRRPQKIKASDQLDLLKPE
jgi:hypothetical protein